MSAVLITADEIACPASPATRGNAVLARCTPDSCEILAVGSVADVSAHPEARGATRRDLPGHILIPGLVNAHTHLDLTAVGPQPRPSGQPFATWLDGVRRARNAMGDDVAAAVELGVRASVRGGVVAVGDIAGRFRWEPLEVVRASPLLGVSFLELFGLGMWQHAAIAQINGAEDMVRADAGAPRRVRIGLSPHAPYSAGPAVFERVTALAESIGADGGATVPVCTHMAESEEEHRMICHGDGPMREFFRSVGVWGRGATKHFKGHRSPIGMAMPWLARAPWLLAHVNDCSDEDLRDLATTRCSVVYCPRSSAYFERDKEFGPHRYRDMLAAGINVALGTDSVVNLPPGAESERISTLDEMRLLFRRDGTDPRTLLAMATINGARALGLDPGLFTLRPGPVAGLIAVPVGARGGGEGGCSTWNSDAFVRALRGESAPVVLWPAV